ncbi:hypothetical protein [Chryseobacterium sp. JK1]|uniref:hypothetical protein n=1 Tax=Chryseobacterium sp. JK1 TaxID=874294 RepID=UPI003D68A176
MKYFLIFALAIIHVKSQLLLNIKSLKTDNDGKIIMLELFNSSNTTYKIPIDTVSFRPFTEHNNIGDLKPVIEIKYNNKSLKFNNNILELNENQLDKANKGKKMVYHENETKLIEIKPKEKFLIPIQFNPFEFNIENGIYNSYNIVNDQDYTITVYLNGRLIKYQAENSNEGYFRYFTGSIKSNPIKVKWNLKNRKHIEW